MTSPSSSARSPHDGFMDHLIALLSVYEVDPKPRASIPQWTGPSSTYTDTILCAVNSLARRAYTAESALEDYKEALKWESGSTSQKRQSAGSRNGPGSPDEVSTKESPPSLPAPEDDNEKSEESGNTSYGSTTETSYLHDTTSSSDLTLLRVQVTDVTCVCRAVARGDLTQKILVDVEGEVMIELKDIINTMVDSLGRFSSEVTRVVTEVGTDGKLGGIAHVEGVEGVWADMTRNVNRMCTSLTEQVRSIARVTTAVAEGDLSQRCEISAEGEIAILRDTVNSMVKQLVSFSSEVTRIVIEVGIRGILGGQARVPDVKGTWAGLTDSVNGMAINLTRQVRAISMVTKAVALGDLTQKVDVEAEGKMLELKETVNTMVDQLGAFSSEVTRVVMEVGTRGILGGQARVPGVQGTWESLTNNVNTMADNLTCQVRSISNVTKAVAEGDLTQQVNIEVQGEMLELKNTVNSMVFQLGAFSSEVTRVAMEVGTRGILGGQAQVPGVQGTWESVTNTVNTMADNLTRQVRSISDVTKAVAAGDLTQKVNVDVQGEMLELKETVNTMVDQLGAFSSEVSRVAEEIGIRGILGGQMEVPGVQGTWAELTNNVNTMADNLTRQVRSILNVMKALAAEDFTQKFNMDVQGKMLELKESVNTMATLYGMFSSTIKREMEEMDEIEKIEKIEMEEV